MSIWTPPPDLDPECRVLCEALNEVPGITTTSSCCGHGEHPYWIFFFADSLDALPLIAWSADSCHSGQPGWQIIVRTDCSAKPVDFLLEGPVGAFGPSERIAATLREVLAED